MVEKSYGLKRNNKADRNFKCQEVNCLEVKKTQGELNKHLQFDHKITFKCFVCDWMYNTANGRSKHYKKHFKFNNTCSECGYSCQFPAQMTVHKCKHTTDNMGKFPCPTRGCSKVLLSKATLDVHRKIHDETRHACDKFPRTLVPYSASTSISKVSKETVQLRFVVSSTSGRILSTGTK